MYVFIYVNIYYLTFQDKVINSLMFHPLSKSLIITTACSDGKVRFVKESYQRVQIEHHESKESVIYSLDSITLVLLADGRIMWVELMNNLCHNIALILS